MSNPYTNYPPEPQGPQNQQWQNPNEYMPPTDPYQSQGQNPYEPTQYAAPPQQYQPYTPAYQPVQSPAEPGSGLAIAGFVLGIVSIPTAFFLGCGALVGLVGIVLSALGRRSVSRRTFATIGLVLSIVGIVVAVLYWLLIIAAATHGSSTNSTY